MRSESWARRERLRGTGPFVAGRCAADRIASQCQPLHFGAHLRRGVLERGERHTVNQAVQQQARGSLVNVGVVYGHDLAAQLGQLAGIVGRLGTRGKGQQGDIEPAAQRRQKMEGALLATTVQGERQPRAHEQHSRSQWRRA